MSKPGDIPQDVWAKVILALDGAWDAHHANFNPASNSISGGLWERFYEAAARAILAAKAEEREGCRRDIRNAILAMPEIQRSNGDLCDEAIAAAIRKRGEG